MIVAAVGVPHVLKADQVKDGAILLDVGVSRAEDPETGKKKLFGDVSPEAAAKASWVSPNPGGVGPMTARSCSLTLWRPQNVRQANCLAASLNSCSCVILPQPGYTTPVTGVTQEQRV